jgi:hypothetical protein
LHLRIKNVTKKPLWLSGSIPEKDYKIEVRDPDGQPAPLTEMAESLLSPETPSVIASKLSAGQEREYTVTLTNLYRITKSGPYLITASREVSTLGSRGAGTVVSNTIRVIVESGE